MVELMPENLLAWDLFHAARLEHIGATIAQLRLPGILEDLGAFDREELAFKLEVIGSTYQEIAVEEQRRREEAAKRGR